MFQWNEKRKWRKFLKQTLIEAGAEIFFIQNVKNINQILHFNHRDYLYTELCLEVEGFSYFETNDTFVKAPIEFIIITFMPHQQVIKVDKDNITLLLLDESELIRYAAQDLYKQQVS